MCLTELGYSYGHDQFYDSLLYTALLTRLIMLGALGINSDEVTGIMVVLVTASLKMRNHEYKFSTVYSSVYC